jgi:hypothetical protein
MCKNYGELKSTEIAKDVCVGRNNSLVNEIQISNQTIVHIEGRKESCDYVFVGAPIVYRNDI